MKNRESSLTTPVDRTVDERDKVDVADVKVIVTRRQGSANQQFRHPPESLELRSKLRDGTRRDLHPRTLDSAQLQLPSSGRHPGSIETGAHAARAKADDAATGSAVAVPRGLPMRPAGDSDVGRGPVILRPSDPCDLGSVAPILMARRWWA